MEQGSLDFTPAEIACGPRRPLDPQQEFEAWLTSDDGKTVYREALRRALLLKGRGYHHYSIDAICHAIRFDAGVRVGPDADGYKINDHITSRLSRRLMADVPELGEPPFFKVRPLRT
jgi:hypothetical protein